MITDHGPIPSFSFLRRCLLFRCIQTWILATSLVGISCAADMDALREPIVRPNAETVRRWLFNYEIVVAKRSLWFDRKANIEPSKITNIAAQGGSVFQKPPPLANYATSVWRFEYPDGNGKTNSYAVFIEYEWSVGVTGIDRKFVKAIVSNL